MADANTFPQLPSTVWRGVWKIFHDSPSRRLDDNILAVELGVQKTAAKQYRKELIRLGLLDDNGSPTDLAKSWRQDGDDRRVLEEILDHAYPEELRHLAPVDNLDRDKIVRWFMSQGLGSGAAKNKAATYIRIANGVSSDQPLEQAPRLRSTPAPRRSVASKQQEQSKSPDELDLQTRPQKAPQLAVNVQIHISADASTEQINAIFSAMRAYFNGDAAS